MLSYPDRQTFEQIRARWESAQPADDSALEMVGRKEKLPAQQPVSSEPQVDTSSRFRRKLSHGLAFISNPLSQRKITPGRYTVKAPLLPVSAPTTLEDLIECHEDHAPSLPARGSASFERSHDHPTQPVAPTNDQSTTKESPDPNATPKPLPRSRTLSFIPRPVRIESMSSSVATESTAKLDIPIVTSDMAARATPSRIPTPSPPLSEHRRVSPRQYLDQHIPQQAYRTAATGAPIRPHNVSPIKVSVRSRTTPNLTKSAATKHPTTLRPPMKAGLRRPSALPVKPNTAQQENVPMNSIVTQRRSEIQERTLKRESLAVAGIMGSRKSLALRSPLEQRKQLNFATSQTTRKRLSSNLAQQKTLTAKRVYPHSHVSSSSTTLSQPASDTSVLQPRLMGPKNPPTPTPLKADPSLSKLPRSSTDDGAQRTTLGTPNGLGGIWRSSRALTVTNHEVRRLPRSRTFHNFGNWEDPPPVPPIPEEYRTVSLSNLFLRGNTNTVVKPRHHRIISDTVTCESIPEEADEDKDTSQTEDRLSTPKREQSCSLKFSDSAESLTALPVILQTIESSLAEPAKQLEDYQSENPNGRPWSIAMYHFPDSADIAPYFQVKDYMPPLYWAGRFQSRYDRWRTDAMAAELDPSQQQLGPLAELKLNQEKLAACYIFAQLRDLCTSNLAADSLWEFEFKYRKENKLLGNPLDLPPMTYRKQDDQNHRGAFGRAVRKLTPRKASFVNLLKGKGWNKDEERPSDASEHAMETSSGSS